PTCPHHRPSDAPIAGGTVQPTANGPDPTLAEGEGFEPPRAWRPLRFSRPLRSTTPASLRGLRVWNAEAGTTARANSDASRDAQRQFPRVLTGSSSSSSEQDQILVTCRRASLIVE